MMERLTRPNVTVDHTADKFMGKEVKLQDVNDRLLDLVLNGPTLNAVSKDVLRQLIRQLYDVLQSYEDTGLTTEEVKDMAENAETRLLTWFEAKYGFPIGKLMDLCEAKQQGRLVTLPCKVGDTVYAVKFATHEETEDGDLIPIAGGGKWVIWPVRVSIIDYCNYLTKSAQGYVLGSTKNGSGATFELEDFGKTIFLTRAEAEAALAEKAYKQVQDAIDRHNRQAMDKIAAFIEPKEGADNVE